MNNLFRVLGADLNPSQANHPTSTLELQKIKRELLTGKTFRVNGSDFNLATIIIEKLAYPSTSKERQLFHASLLGLLASTTNIETLDRADKLKELIESDLHALAVRIQYQSNIH